MFKSKTIITGTLLAAYNLFKGMMPQELQEVINEDFVNQVGMVIMLIFMRMGIGVDKK